MNKLGYYLSFISRLAILCNISFLLSLMVIFNPFFHTPEFLASFFGALGLQLAPFINFVFIVLYVIQKAQGKIVNVPTWQTVNNLVAFLLEILCFMFII